jgi:hypothetical protein
MYLDGMIASTSIFIFFPSLLDSFLESCAGGYNVAAEAEVFQTFPTTTTLAGSVRHRPKSSTSIDPSLGVFL